MIAQDNTPLPPGRILAIDYGERRVGLAMTDPNRQIAQALLTLQVRSRKRLLQDLQTIIDEQKIVQIIIGNPIGLDGSPTHMSRRVTRFILDLRTIFPGDIIEVDERFSSAQARRVLTALGGHSGRKKEAVDRMAATLLLQHHLETQAAHASG